MLICVRANETLLPLCQVVRAKELICDVGIRNQGGLGLQLSLQRMRQRPSLRQPAELQHQKVATGFAD